MPPRKFTLPFFSPRTKSKPSEHPNTTPSAIHTPQHAKPQPQQAHPQQQSLFFSKLPPELRIEVYQLLIPRSKCISVETRQAMLRHMPLDPECTNEEERKPWTRDPRRIVEEHDTEWHRRPRMTQWDYGWTRGDVQELDVFLACRRIYHEVAELLYSSRTFCIGSPITLVKLYETIPLRHFNRIAALQMIFCANYAAPTAPVNISTFRRFRNILMQMPNLRELRIVLPSECWRGCFMDLKEGESDTLRLETREHWRLYHALCSCGIYDAVECLVWLREIRCENIRVLFLEKRWETAPDGSVDSLPWVARTELRVGDGEFVKCGWDWWKG